MEEEVKDSGGLCQGVLKTVLIINHKEDLIWEASGKKRYRTILNMLHLRLQEHTKNQLPSKLL